MFALPYSNSLGSLYESQCGFIDKLWILNSYFKHHNSHSHPWNAFITKKLALHKIFFGGMGCSWGTRFPQPRLPLPQPDCLGGRFLWVGLHSSISERGLTTDTWQTWGVGKGTTAELTPQCTCEIKEGNANNEEVSFQPQMQVCLGQPFLK